MGQFNLDIFSGRQIRFSTITVSSILLFVIFDYCLQATTHHGAGIDKKFDTIQHTKQNHKSTTDRKNNIGKNDFDAGDIARGLEVKPIDVNSASIDELMKLPGVGRTLAHKIIEYRQKNGKFKNITELMKINGIGTKKLNKLKHMAVAL